MDLPPEIQGKFDALKEKLQCSDDELISLLIETFESSQAPKKKYLTASRHPSIPNPSSFKDKIIKF